MLLAVSGGLDSAVLCHLCSRAGFSFDIAHCNFGLRGAESDRDEAFVRQLAHQYHAAFFVTHFPTKAYAEAHRLSIQEAARKLRYDFFSMVLKGQVRAEDGPAVSNRALQSHSFLLTAHHRDDNLETVLMNVFKGTGISGLRGILPKQGKIIRPLLFAGRNEVFQYATAYGLEWVEDSSNEETKYTRNYVRHTLLPAIEKVFPSVRQNLAAGIQRFVDIELIYRTAIEKERKRLLEWKGKEVHIPVLKLAKTPALHSVVYEIIKDFGFGSRQVEEVIKLLNSETGRFIDGTGYRILRNRAWLVITPFQDADNGIYLLEEGQTEVHFADRQLKLEAVPAERVRVTADPNLALVDAGQVVFPLILRKWKQGDYFYPLGLRHKKKLSRFFIDSRLSKNEKENIWVLLSGGRIVWVLGLRIDDRFRVTDSTKKVLKISFQKATP